LSLLQGEDKNSIFVSPLPWAGEGKGVRGGGTPAKPIYLSERPSGTLSHQKEA